MDRSTPFSMAFFTLHLIGFRGNLATEQESNHHEISLTSGMANSNDYFSDVGGSTLGLYQENASTATSKKLLPLAPLLSNLGRWWCIILWIITHNYYSIWCDGCYNLSHMNWCIFSNPDLLVTIKMLPIICTSWIYYRIPSRRIDAKV